MKAEELMIGDWVYNTHNRQPEQVCEIREHMVMLAYNDLYDYDEIEPIPLNDEILQKNGFRRVGERWGCGDELNSYYFGNGQDIDIHLPTNSDKYMLVIRDHVSPDPDYQLISRLKHVHKLQHALKEYMMTAVDAVVSIPATPQA